MKRMGLRILVFILLTGPCLAGFHEDYIQMRRTLIRKRLKASNTADIQALQTEREKQYRQLLEKYDPATLKGEDRGIAIRMLLDLEEYARAWDLLSDVASRAGEDDQWVLAAAAEARFGLKDRKGTINWLDQMNHARAEYSRVCMRISRKLIRDGKQGEAVPFLKRAAFVPTLDPRIRRQVVRGLLRIYEDEQNKDAAMRTIAELTKASFMTSGEKKELIQEARRLRMLGEAAPELQPVLSWIQGDPQRLSDLKGSVVVLDFFAPWCGPCVKSFAGIRQMYHRFKSQGLRVIGITRLYGNYRDDRTIEKNVSESRELTLIHDFVKRWELDWPVAVTRDETGMFKSYMVRSIPRLVVIDREGRIRATFVGFDPSGKAERFIEQLLKQ